MAKSGSSSAAGKLPGVETSFRDSLPLALESELGSGGATCGRAPCLWWNLITPWRPHEMAGGGRGAGAGGGARGWVESSSPEAQMVFFFFLSESALASFCSDE